MFLAASHVASSPSVSFVLLAVAAFVGFAWFLFRSKLALPSVLLSLVAVGLLALASVRVPWQRATVGVVDRVDRQPQSPPGSTPSPPSEWLGHHAVCSDVCTHDQVALRSTHPRRADDVPAEPVQVQRSRRRQSPAGESRSSDETPARTRRRPRGTASAPAHAGESRAAAETSTERETPAGSGTSARSAPPAGTETGARTESRPRSAAPADARTGPPPAWTRSARRADQVADDETHVVLVSGLFATAAEAEADLLRQAADLVAERLRKNNSLSRSAFFPNADSWKPDPTLVSDTVVRRTYLQAVRRDLGVVEATMYRLYAELDLSPSALRAIEERLRRTVGRLRAALAVVVLLVVSALWAGLWVLSGRLQARRRSAGHAAASDQGSGRPKVVP